MHIDLSWAATQENCKVFLLEAGVCQRQVSVVLKCYKFGIWNFGLWGLVILEVTFMEGYCTWKEL